MWLIMSPNLCYYKLVNFNSAYVALLYFLLKSVKYVSREKLTECNIEAITNFFNSG